MARARPARPVTVVFHGALHSDVAPCVARRILTSRTIDGCRGDFHRETTSRTGRRRRASRPARPPTSEAPTRTMQHVRAQSRTALGPTGRPSDTDPQCAGIRVDSCAALGGESDSPRTRSAPRGWLAGPSRKTGHAGHAERESPWRASRGPMEKERAGDVEIFSTQKLTVRPHTLPISGMPRRWAIVH